ncbi:site-specific integrase [Paenibacillus alvei]|uniref:Site-specific integrase n=1 Tax=Paenibacillus alvei TaxID=44250 RepID=A0ABT4H6J6_PAEAL|nr:site-specific integrase [Paenibacillus alvei]EJW14403.1 integrase family protein [Paenibacillus alvei DSM 29]MCY9539877.1 site-specific integrase [Paenibacillus alvei]MCY9708690.1 site-specific integrase [Paenibacillus alvei]MCY9737275.1 site-specific integrase [Paenibacillus alvei]MCY9758121.1 site-specific integrase [Paenibacillus alvei]
MATYEKRGKNSYRLTIEGGYLPDGTRERFRKSIKVDESLQKAPRKLKEYLYMEIAKFQAEVECGTYIAPEKMNFTQFTDEWKEKFVLKHLEYKSQENYLHHLEKRILPHFGSKKISTIKTMQIIDFLHNLKKLNDQSKPVGSATQAYVYRVLNSIFSKATEWKVISINPMDGVTKPKEPERNIDLNVYDDKELMLLFAALKNTEMWFQIVILLAVTTGMRRAEILGLDWKYINLKEGIISIRQSIPAFKDGQPVIKDPKTKGSKRNIAISSYVVQQLEIYKNEWNNMKNDNADIWEGTYGDLLFCNNMGFPFHPKTLTEKWRDFNNTIPDLKFIRFHDFRHTSASILIGEGAHAKTISNRLGHSKIGTTMDVYGHIIESVDRKTASIFDNVLFTDHGD